jgi:hypothetical protein
MENHTESIKTMWFINCLQYTADWLNKPVVTTAELLDKHGLINWALDGYEVLHTQGYEYMAEVLTDTLRERQGAVA